MVEFLRKSESRCDKIVLQQDSHRQIHQFTLILYGVGMRCGVGTFKPNGPCTVHL